MDPLIIILLLLISVTLIIVVYYLFINKKYDKYVINQYYPSKKENSEPKPKPEKVPIYIPIYKNDIIYPHSYKKCSDTKFGCCANGRNPRLTTNDSYCPKYEPIKKSGCQGSRFGCCPNGTRERKNPNGLNCPRIKQERMI